MVSHRIDKVLKKFLNNIFCVVGPNSPYQTGHFVQVLLDAAEHEDFVNNTSKRVGGPTGETVFDRLKNADFERINQAFHHALKSVFNLLKRHLRNRRVALAFDTTDEPFYGKIEGLWIHHEQPVRGSTGCFKFITVSCADRNNRLILASLPVRIGADTARLVMQLIEQVKQYVNPEILLFDRGFDNYQLVEALQRAGLRYQILWRKSGWTSKSFKKMKRGQIKEINRQGKYSRNKTKYKIKLRFVLIKKYRRYKNTKAYNWVFATNTRQKNQHSYVDKYRKRWSIETVFRVLDNVQIKTTTKNELIRYFINLFCCLIYNLWKCTNAFECHMTLKNFTATLVDYVKSILQLEVPDD